MGKIGEKWRSVKSGQEVGNFVCREHLIFGEKTPELLNNMLIWTIKEQKPEKKR